MMTVAARSRAVCEIGVGAREADRYPAHGAVDPLELIDALLAGATIDEGDQSVANPEQFG